MYVAISFESPAANTLFYSGQAIRLLYQTGTTSAFSLFLSNGTTLFGPLATVTSITGMGIYFDLSPDSPFAPSLCLLHSPCADPGHFRPYHILTVARAHPNYSNGSLHGF
jgi:hypothetical protein